MEIKGDSKIANPNEWVENDEIPDCLMKLTKIILRAFYSPKHIGRQGHNRRFKDR